MTGYTIIQADADFGTIRLQCYGKSLFQTEIWAHEPGLWSAISSFTDKRQARAAFNASLTRLTRKSTSAQSAPSAVKFP